MCTGNKYKTYRHPEIITGEPQIRIRAKQFRVARHFIEPTASKPSVNKLHW